MCVSSLRAHLLVCCMCSTSLPLKWWQGIRRTGQRDPTVPSTSLWLRWQGQSPGRSGKTSSQQADRWLPFTSHWNFKRGGSWESADRLGYDSAAGEWGTLGSWCAEAELCERKIKSRPESLLKQGTKPLWRTAGVWKGYSCALATETHIYKRGSCAISLVFQSSTALILSGIRSLPSPHSAVPSSVFSCESTIFTCKWRDPVRLKCSKCCCRGGDSPRREQREVRRKHRPSLDLCKPRGAFSISFLKSRLWRGGSRTQTCEIGLKISCLHCFPNCTVFNYFLLVTLGWHIQVYFVLWFSWDDLIA